MRIFHQLPAHVRLVATPEETGSDGGEPKSFTQEQVDRIVETRLAKERGKYKDYEEIKAKALKFEEAENAGKSEVDKLREANERLQKQIDDAAAAKQRDGWISEVSKSKDVPAELLRGTTLEELEAHADLLHAALHPASSGAPVSKQTGEPTHQKQTGDADERAYLQQLLHK